MRYSEIVSIDKITGFVTFFMDPHCGRPPPVGPRWRGRFEISGSFGFFTGGPCDGSPQPWSAEVIASNGRFAGGRSASVALGLACGGIECAFGYVEQDVMLRGARR